MNTRTRSTKRSVRRAVTQLTSKSPARRASGPKKDPKKSKVSLKSKSVKQDTRGKSTIITKKTEQQTRALDLLREANDLPTAYASLYVLQNDIGLQNMSEWASEADKELIQQAFLSVPYLMFQRAKEMFEEKGLVRDPLEIFKTMGPSCCSQKLDRKAFVKACSFLNRSEAVQALPLLHGVGKKARSKLKTIRQLMKAT